jgi:hypothetical protein
MMFRGSDHRVVTRKFIMHRSAIGAQSLDLRTMARFSLVLVVTTRAESHSKLMRKQK